MAGKSPEKPAPEEQPSSGGVPTSEKASVEGPSSIPPTPVVSPLLARRLGARVLDPETAVLAPDRPTPLPTVYVADTLLVRDIVDPFLDAGGAKTRVEELIEFAGSQTNPLVLKQVGEPASVPLRRRSDSLGPDARVTVTRVRLERHPTQVGKVPDAWRFLQDALTAPSERGRTLYDKLDLGKPPERDESVPETEAEKRRRERRDRRGTSMASGVSVEHVLTAGGGVWGGGGGVWGGGGGVWGGGGGVWGGGGGVWGAEACSPSTAAPASAAAHRSSGRRPTRERSSARPSTHPWWPCSTPAWGHTRGSPPRTRKALRRTRRSRRRTARRGTARVPTGG